MKWILLLVLLLGAFLGGWYAGSSKKRDVVYIHDTTPPVHIIIKPIDATDTTDLLLRAESPIEIHRAFQDPLLTLKATDGYKSTTVVDRITFRPKKHFVFGGAGVDKTASLIYSIGYHRAMTFFDGLYLGCILSFNSSSFNSVSVMIGYSF